MADSMANKKRRDYARLITGRNRDDSFFPMIYEAFGAAQPKVKEGLSELFDPREAWVGLRPAVPP